MAITSLVLKPLSFNNWLVWSEPFKIPRIKCSMETKSSFIFFDMLIDSAIDFCVLLLKCIFPPFTLGNDCKILSFALTIMFGLAPNFLATCGNTFWSTSIIALRRCVFSMAWFPLVRVSCCALEITSCDLVVNWFKSICKLFTHVDQMLSQFKMNDKFSDGKNITYWKSAFLTSIP